jgi:hypothetical protein
VDADNLIHFTFGFYIEGSGGAQFRFFRPGS